MKATTAKEIAELPVFSAEALGGIVAFEASRTPDPARGNAEQASDEGCLLPHIPTSDVSNLPFANHRHCFVVGPCTPGGSHAAEAKPGPDQPLDLTVILLDELDDIVDVFALVWPRLSTA